MTEATALRRLLFVADLRSPLAQSWIGNLAQRGSKVAALSTFPLSSQPSNLYEVTHLPTLRGAWAARFHRLQTRQRGGSADSLASIIRTASALTPAIDRVKTLFAPIDTRRARRQVRETAASFRPDLLHALRIPYEGIIAIRARPPLPIVLSIWGNDLTLHAARDGWTAKWTRHSLERATALICDCARDIHLAADWGFDATKPAIILPGGGGVDTDLFSPGPPGEGLDRFGLPHDALLVFNPRGYRHYVRLHDFLEAAELVIKKRPDVVVACAGLDGVLPAEDFVQRRGVADRLLLLPVLTRAEMAALFKQSAISVSPTVQDGSPNSLLEAMACGCLPIAGDIEAVREWIASGVNGLLWDLSDSRSLAELILEGLSNSELRRRAAAANRETILQKASRSAVTLAAEAFYGQVSG